MARNHLDLTVSVRDLDSVKQSFQDATALFAEVLGHWFSAARPGVEYYRDDIALLEGRRDEYRRRWKEITGIEVSRRNEC